MPGSLGTLFLWAMALGVLVGALFGIGLWRRERDPGVRLIWSMRFWAMVTAILGLCGLFAAWMARP